MQLIQLLFNSPHKSYESRRISIPSGWNLLITLGACLLALYCLWGASKADTVLIKVGYAIGFSLVGNTIFSLLHEAVHRILHHKKSVNDILGQILAQFFPTGFHFQRAFHLGHHRRNRTDVELFDQYGPDDNKLLKFTQLYTVLLGLYWTAAPLGGLLYLISPSLLNSSLFRSQKPSIRALSMDAMLSGLDQVKGGRIRSELFLTFLFQLGLFYFLHLHFLSWLLCYWCFAVLWGSLQYADHAWSQRDIRNGAWNLKVNFFIHWVFLHYHHHLAHHQHPSIPWIHLRHFVDTSQPRPTHFSIWLRMWKGPIPVEQESPLQLEDYFERSLYFGLENSTGESIK